MLKIDLKFIDMLTLINKIHYNNIVMPNICTGLQNKNEKEKKNKRKLLDKDKEI